MCCLVLTSVCCCTAERADVRRGRRNIPKVTSRVSNSVIQMTSLKWLTSLKYVIHDTLNRPKMTQRPRRRCRADRPADRLYQSWEDELHFINLWSGSRLLVSKVIRGVRDINVWTHRKNCGTRVTCPGKKCVIFFWQRNMAEDHPSAGQQTVRACWPYLCVLVPPSLCFCTWPVSILLLGRFILHLYVVCIFFFPVLVPSSYWFYLYCSCLWLCILCFSYILVCLFGFFFICLSVCFSFDSLWLCIFL